MSKVINLKMRINPYTISAVVSTVFMALDINPSSLTSWAAVLHQLERIVENPFLLATVAITTVGVIHDPTTAGFKDCDIVLQAGNGAEKNIKT